ncbi:MAG: type II secretion system F family protein [Pseudomonadota bacterium]
MPDTPLVVLLGFTVGVFALSVFGLRGFLDLRDALRFAELARLAAPVHWQATRAWAGACASIPVLIVAAGLGAGAWLAAAAVAALGYWVAPQFLAAARRRVEREVLADLALHLDLIALAMEAGSSLPAALSICAERAPAGALQRAWARVILDIHSGSEPLEALRALEQRMGLRPVTSLVVALRSAERFGIEFAQVMRDRARQSAAHRFARAERLARAAPLKLWATLVLCIAPCTLVVLAFPVARVLALLAGK